jgi:DNA-dependent RNA polymerase auxiliary subunit epsilon
MMLKKGLVEVNVKGGTNPLNTMGYTNFAPKLALKDINYKIEQLEKLSGKKLPRATYNKSTGQYEVPRIYFTRLKQGGSINKEDEYSLAKLDQLTNFTNYNTKQPGGWLDNYN